MWAEPRFDRAAFRRALATRRLGRTLIARAEVESTNDVAWEALAQNAGEGVTVVADAQTRGRGREGRRWHLAPGRGLALSVALFQGCDGPGPGTVPLAAGLAMSRAAQRLGLAARLKWPNDVLAGTRKLCGILCESRRVGGNDAVVIGVGVNVHEQRDDFPPELREIATSFAMEGRRVTREQVAAEFLNALEPLWGAHEEGGRESVVAAWRAQAGFWGRPVTVHTPGGPLHGVARDLDEGGGLVVRLESGREVVALAGDLEVSWPEERA
jgi:BirA family biotin operon repressor/biotin-[acetyl-CoA-carboxylase] ligase